MMRSMLMALALEADSMPQAALGASKKEKFRP